MLLVFIMFGISDPNVGVAKLRKLNVNRVVDMLSA